MDEQEIESASTGSRPIQRVLDTSMRPVPASDQPSTSTSNDAGSCFDGEETGRRDGQDFVSWAVSVDQSETDLDERPFIPECEVFEEGGPEAIHRFRTCSCKDNFIPVNTFKLDAVPQPWRSDWTESLLKEISARTVKITVKYTSTNRPKNYPNSTAPYPYAEYRGKDRVVRCGTGFIYGSSPRTFETGCPCPECKQSGNPEDFYFTVSVCTAAHVVFDDAEAEKTVCEVFYDSENDIENRDKVKILYGQREVPKEKRKLFDDISFSNFAARCTSDVVFFECLCHDIQLYKTLKKMLTVKKTYLLARESLSIIVSHPHGWSKQVSVGTCRHYSLHFSENYSPDSECVISENQIIMTTTDLSQYLNYFEKHKRVDNWYWTKQPLKVHIGCDHVSNTATLQSVEEDLDFVNLPTGSTLTCLDGTLVFPVEHFKLEISRVLNIFKSYVETYHMIYDTPTCNGSSGAFVVTSMIFRYIPCHFGKLATGWNRSGTYNNNKSSSSSAAATTAL